MRSNLLRNTFIVTLIMVALYGCSHKELQVSNMVLKSSDFNLSPISKSCRISQVEGRKEADGMLLLTSSILEQAITESLKTSNLFSTVKKYDQKDADYTLSARLLGQPLDWSSSTTCVYTRYKLINNSNGEVLLDKRYQTTYSSPEKDRLKSMEGAVKGNIKELIGDLSKLQL